ncbi:hypothetical protein A0H81_02225 [Grifola frondosa]|uniref:Uncharacterized protein n=1 Tax=Grifola frondosa TaxID=5627 RepID=A0A1C7MN69_GRIFR|nr:hypothetical protein A0H81_02225 [Grifola frondosa]
MLNHSVLTDVLGTAHESPQLCQMDVSEYPRLPDCDATLDRHPSSLPMATLSYMSTLHSTGRRIASASSMSLGSRVGSAQSSLLSDTPSFAAFKMLRLDGDELDEAQSHMADDSPLRNKGRKNRTLHREVTMHNLVHKLDSSRSRSLTALIHALDNASPGLYQSLVNCATMPACISDCSLISIDEESQEHIYSLGSAGPSGVERQAGVPAHALPSDILDELDILAAKIRKLPLPQGPTLLPPDADDAFPTTAIHTRAIESSPINNHEQCAYTSRKTAYVSPQTHLSTPESVAGKIHHYNILQTISSPFLGPIVSWSIPKLTRTFGRRSRNTVTPRKRSSDAANDAHSLARSSDIARRISHSPPPSTPLVTVKSPGATPKSSRIKSFFRRGPRCSAPPALENIGKKASQIPRTTRCNQQEALAGVPRSPYRGDLGLHNGPFSHL